jgi:hypothetical protein
MSLSRLRLVPSALALAAVAVLAGGCSTTPTAPAPTSTGGTEPSTAPTAPGERDSGDVGVAWLASGASIGIVTWGSSSKDCQPHKADAKADGQTIEVTLTDRAGENTACTADYGPRAIAFPVPDGVDVTKDVDVKVAYRDLKEDADLDALDAAPIDAPLGEPSAGWFDDDGILMMTYGSSTCPPVPEQVVQTKDQISVSFATLDRVCTMDLSPRVTVIQLTEERQGAGPFTLRMQGDGLSGEVPVLG